MRTDIQSYNQETLESETQMLLYNVGQLSKEQPPHFMMLATVSQSRTFSATAGFQWTQILSAINPVTLITRTLSGTTITTTSSSIGKQGAWQAGPFSTTSNENPTITFIPVQGQEFFNRFESPMRDKFSDVFQLRHGSDYLVDLFVDSLTLLHGETSGFCPKAHYVNNYISPLLAPQLPPDYCGYKEFKACLDEILGKQQYSRTRLYLGKLEGHHQVPTNAGADPSATDVVDALDKGYEWIKRDNDFVLTTPLRMPAWLDYNPNFEAPALPESNLEPALVLYHGPKGGYGKQPGPLELTYGTPKGYSWKEYLDNRGQVSYALVPDGYGIEGGRLMKLEAPCKARQCEEDKTRLLYSDKIIEDRWPFPSDFIYLELRRGSVFNRAAEAACFGSKKEQEEIARKEKGIENLVCGYFRIGNLLHIMQRLADMAKGCHERKDPYICEGSVFAIGSDVPSWADRWERIGSGEFIYEPAHDSFSTPDLARRDRESFSALYQLYQVSLVNTSQLVTSAPPITISK